VWLKACVQATLLRYSHDFVSAERQKEKIALQDIIGFGLFVQSFNIGIILGSSIEVVKPSEIVLNFQTQLSLDRDRKLGAAPGRFSPRLPFLY